MSVLDPRRGAKRPRDEPEPVVIDLDEVEFLNPPSLDRLNLDLLPDTPGILCANIRFRNCYIRLDDEEKKTIPGISRTARYITGVNICLFDNARTGILDSLVPLLDLLSQGQNVERIVVKGIWFTSDDLTAIFQHLETWPRLFHIGFPRCGLYRGNVNVLSRFLPRIQSLRSIDISYNRMLEDRDCSNILYSLGPLLNLRDINMKGTSGWTETLGLFCNMGLQGTFSMLQRFFMDCHVFPYGAIAPLVTLLSTDLLPDLVLLSLDSHIVLESPEIENLPHVLCRRTKMVKTSIAEIDQFVEAEFETKQLFVAGFDALRQTGFNLDILLEVADALPKQSTFREFLHTFRAPQQAN